MTLRRIAAWFGIAAALYAVAAGAGQADDKVVRASLNTELQVLDPIVTTINATRVFAYLVFDQLVGIEHLTVRLVEDRRHRGMGVARPFAGGEAKASGSRSATVSVASAPQNLTAVE